MAPPLNRVQREKIIALYQSGYRNMGIVRRLGISKYTVAFWIRRFKETGDISSHHRQIYQRATTAEQDAEILSAHLQDPSLSMRVTSTQYNVSTETVRRRIKEGNRRQRRPAKKLSMLPSKREVHAQTEEYRDDAVIIDGIKREHDVFETEEFHVEDQLEIEPTVLEPHHPPVVIPNGTAVTAVWIKQEPNMHETADSCIKEELQVEPTVLQPQFPVVCMPQCAEVKIEPLCPQRRPYEEIPLLCSKTARPEP